MDKIKEFRRTQSITLEQFIEKAINDTNCKYCTYHDECKEYMGVESIEDEIGVFSCAAFDNSIEGLKTHYIKEYVK